MLLKSADDKSTRLALLEELQRSQLLDSPAKAFDSNNVIKADQFPTSHQRFVDKIGVGNPSLMKPHSSLDFTAHL